jgi:hypothetical protein
VDKPDRRGVVDCLGNGDNDRLGTFPPQIIDDNIDSRPKLFFPCRFIPFSARRVGRIEIKRNDHVSPESSDFFQSLRVTAGGNDLRGSQVLGDLDGESPSSASRTVNKHCLTRVAGSRLTDTVYMETAERIGKRLVDAGFSVRQTVVLLSTVYTFTITFVIEEQGVFPVEGKRSPAYDLQKRNAKLDPRKFPILRQSGAILFERFEQRYKDSLGLIVGGASFPKM